MTRAILREAAGVVVLCAVASVIWTLRLGPDINSDFLGYHLYIGLHAGGDALRDNYFPAGSSSYLLPYANWPLSAMIGAGWPARVIGAVLSMLQSLAGIATWAVAYRLFPGRTVADTLSRLLGTILGLLSPLALAAIGSSHVDLLTSIPVVAGVALMLRGLTGERSSFAPMVAAGACFGVATALKLTNATMAVAAGLTVFTLALARRDVRWTAVAGLAVGGLTGAIVSYGYWGYRLWVEFGNPMFPFFDPAFRAAPAAVAASAGPEPGILARFAGAAWTFRDGLHQRFLAHGWSEWLLRPLYMLDPTNNVYAEVRAPDSRFLVLFLLLPFALWIRPAPKGGSRRAGAFGPLVLFWAFGWLIWMLLFGNGRYMLPLALVAGPMLVECARRLLGRRPDWVYASLVILTIAHGLLVFEGGRFRWGEAAWQDRWLTATLPKSVTERPVTFVVLNPLPQSWLTLFMHPRSRIVHPDSMSIRSSKGRVAERLTSLLAGDPPLVAVFSYGLVDTDSGRPVPPTPVEMRPAAERFGIVVDYDHCETGRLFDGRPVTTAVVATQRDGSVTRRASVAGFFFCPARRDPSVTAPPLDPTVEAAFDNLERACPLQMPPRSTQTICMTTACFRRYPTTDVIASIDSEGEVTMTRYGGFDRPLLGTLQSIARSAEGIDCRPDFGRYVPFDPGANILSRPKARTTPER